jgi:hypothetical protein
VLIEGDNRMGLRHTIASRLAAAGLNIDFLVAQVSGDRHSTVIGFENPNHAASAAPLITQAAATARRPVARKTAPKGPSKERQHTRTRPVIRAAERYSCVVYITGRSGASRLVLALPNAPYTTRLLAPPRWSTREPPLLVRGLAALAGDVAPFAGIHQSESAMLL